LTGVQAFLRDELLTFCREAPPEFNEHQRDVFCVFSGTGVARLRDFLNEQKMHAAAHGSVTPSVASEHDLIDVDIDDQNPDSDGSNTPIVDVNVPGHFAHGQSSMLPGPTSVLAGMPFPPIPPFHNYPGPGMGGTASPLSQSAPATTGSAAWAGVPSQQHHQQHGGAQHVTGMMGATVLDEVDGDEAFGEGSEIMDRD
jgi:F-box and leucine-rich repeat protein GRR1